MTIVSASLVQELRIRTGAGIMECKKALIQSQGNIELAIDNLRKIGLIKSSKKKSFITKEGIVISLHHINKVVLLEVNCETDFVSRHEDFVCFCKKVVLYIAENNITDINTLKYKMALDVSKISCIFNENIVLNRLGIIAGDCIASYVHHNRIGVLVGGQGLIEREIKNVAMHIAASKPEYLSEENIPISIIDREYTLQLDIVSQFKKNKDISNKIVEGRLRKFKNEISLLGQNFIFESNKTIKQFLDEKNAKITQFIRFEIGENCI